MRLLLITDLHFTDKPVGLLEAQKKCILRLLQEEKPTEVIIMGDLMMYRKPSPSVLLALKEVVDYLKRKDVPLTILRGNHDSETKADDGVTALSLYNYHADVITEYSVDHQWERAWIPHYEDEDYIKKLLKKIPEGYTVYGHFGYYGSLNSVGDADFNIELSDFRTPTFLGHVHGYLEKENVTILGTPYTTNFGEAFKDSFYAIVEDDTHPYESLRTLNHGPRHLVYAAKDIEANLEDINDPEWFTMLRILVDIDHHPIPYDKLKVPYIDVKYNPVFNEEEVSSYEPERNLFSINEMIIEDYVDGANSIIPKEVLMKGYRSLKDEN
jgi:DNA repair exonuclease SbcCD nuclease subunit